MNHFEGLNHVRAVSSEEGAKSRGRACRHPHTNHIELMVSGLLVHTISPEVNCSKIVIL